MNLNLFKGKSKRTKIFTAITFCAIAVLLTLNFLLTYLFDSYALMLDMTPEGFYSISKEMKKECDSIFTKLEENENQKKIKITFCNDPDFLKASRVTRMPYVMAEKLENKYPDAFEVEVVNVNLNPTAVAKYRPTSLSQIKTNNIIVSYGDRYRVTTAEKFWAEDGDIYYYNGEYRLASLMKSVTAVEHPSAYFVTDHGETYYDPQNPTSEMSLSMSAFADLLIERGLTIKTLSLSDPKVERVPEDCVLLIINNPTKDFEYDKDKLNSLSYVSDTEKLDRYLVMKQGSIMVAKDFERNLPVFESFMYEWGFKFSDSILVDKESSLDDENDEATNLIAKYSTDPDSFAYAIYGEYADLSSAPLTVVPNAGSIECSYNESNYKLEVGSTSTTRHYASFLSTSKAATRYVKENGEITSVVDGAPGVYDVAAVAVRIELDQFSDESKYSYIFCVNSAEFLKNSCLGVDSRANYDIVSAVVENISRIDEHASTDLGGLSQNSTSMGGKKLITMSMSAIGETIYSNKYNNNNPLEGRVVIKYNHPVSLGFIIGYAVFIFAVPIAAAVAGIVVSVKRRYK